MAAPTLIYRTGGGAVIPAIASVAKASHWQEKLQIDQTFLPVKAVYFLMCSGSVCLEPFMSVFMAYIGLNPIQIGIAIGLQPFVGMITSSLCGSLADKFNKHKLLLIIGILGTGLVYGCGVFIPLLNPHQSISWTNVTNTSFLIVEPMKTHPIDRKVDDINTYKGEITISKIYDTIVAGQLDGLIDFSSQNYISVIFPVTIIYLIAARAFSNYPFPLLDSATMGIIKQYKEKGLHAEYGRQRLWGAVGWGIFAPIAGYAVDTYASAHPDSFNRYLPAFILCAALNLFAVLPAIMILMPPREAPESMSRELGFILRKPHIILFLLVLFVSGMSIGVITTYLFLFLQELSGSHTLMGLCKTLTSVSEVPFMFFAHWLIKKLSERGVLSLALFCYALRFAGYALLSDPWLVLLIELLHGITQGALWPASTSYVNMIAPENLATTVQSIANGTRLGLGFGTGTLLGGFIFHHYGPRNLFWGMAVLCVATLLLYLPASTYFERRDARRTIQIQYEEL